MIENFKKYSDFNFEKTKFVGYETLNSKAKILALFDQDQNQVQKLDKIGYVIFDQTPLYAMGGGQSSDQGKIIFKNSIIELIDLRKDIVSGYYIHQINPVSVELKIGDEVEIQVDENFRNKSSINHSSLHISWGVILNEIGHHVDELGSKLDDKKFQIQLVLDDELTIDLVEKAIEKINNKIVLDDIKTNIFEVDEQTAKDKNYLFEFTKIEPGEKVRMVEFQDIMIEPCSGTHLKSTKEIQKVYLLNYDKNNKRILIDMTANQEFANQYFKEKINDKVDEIINLYNKAKNNGFKNDLSNLIDKANNLKNIKSYSSIQKLNEINNEITKQINIFNKELEKNILIDFINLELNPIIENNNFVVYLTNEILYTNKILLGKAIKKTELINNKVLVFLNQTDKGLNTVIIRNQEFNYDLKKMANEIANQTSFKGGGTSSMIQMISQNIRDLEILKKILEN